MKTNKTNLEWLQEMDEPERSQAIENCEKENTTQFVGNTSISDALLGAFHWDLTPEDINYWKSIYNKYAPTDGKL